MSSPSFAVSRPAPLISRGIPLSWVMLLALLVHGPLLLLQLPNDSYDANFHKFFASHYAQHWFDPWNEKQFTGFSQTTYPPMEQQWLALLSHVTGLNLAYMIVQFIAILLLPLGVYRYARIWVEERAASYAAAISVLLGSLSFLVYNAGQLSTTWAAPLYLLAMSYAYEWAREAKFGALLKGLFLLFAAASAHHVTLIFASFIFALPVVAVAFMDRRRDDVDASVAGVASRTILFGILAIAGVIVVLYPFWVAIIANPIKQMPIPHASRNNFFLQPQWGMNFFVVPWGAMILAIPYVFVKGLKEPRLRPLFLAFWVAMLFALGGTTPLPRWLLGRAFEVLTFERFSLLANVMALPIVGLLVAESIDRYGRKAAYTVGALAALTMGCAVAWPVYHVSRDKPFSVDEVISFLNRDGHDKFRYLTLGFGASKFDMVSTYTTASSVDGDYNSARLLPEMTQYGAGQLTNAKYYGTSGMESLRAMLKHADHYGLKYIFVRDPHYEPLLAFAGWREEETYDRGNVTLWVKDGIAPARPSDLGLRPTRIQGIMWGTLPIGSSIVALLLVLLLPDKRRASPAETLEFPITTTEPVLKEAR
jgi:6-pyruvoyl-tetrahydropterin synthase-like protein